MAVEFRAECPSQAAFRGVDIIRTPITGHAAGIITSVNATCVATHYWGNRTIPHDTDDCPACTAGRRKQWHVYLGLWTPERRAHELFECTDYAALGIHAAWKRHHSLRGITLRATRQKQHAKAKVLITLNDTARDKYAMPAPMDIPKILAHIWGINIATHTIIDKLEEDRERWLQFSRGDNGPEH